MNKICVERAHEESIADILKKPYSRVFQLEEDGRISACVLEFPGCCTDGESFQDAWDNLEDAVHSWLECTLKSGISVPPPCRETITRIHRELCKNTGKHLVLNLPRT